VCVSEKNTLISIECPTTTMTFYKLTGVCVMAIAKVCVMRKRSLGGNPKIENLTFKV